MSDKQQNETHGLSGLMRTGRLPRRLSKLERQVEAERAELLKMLGEPSAAQEIMLDHFCIKRKVSLALMAFLDSRKGRRSLVVQNPETGEEIPGTIIGKVLLAWLNSAERLALMLFGPGFKGVTTDFDKSELEALEARFKTEEKDAEQSGN